MTDDRTPRVGLVLGAGGVTGGAFHAGVLAALAEGLGWDPRTAEIIVGTSAGSISGAALRAGLSAPDQAARAEDRPLSPEGQRILAGVGATAPPAPRRPRSRAAGEVAATVARAAAKPLAVRPWSLAATLLPEGSVSTDVITQGIDGLVPGAWPDASLWVCAVRQRDARRVVFGRRARDVALSDAVAASCAIPGFFRPVVIDGEPHIDGGVHSPTNADVLLAAGPLDLVVVSSPMSRRGRRPRLAADQAMRTWSRAVLDAEARRLRRRGVPVVAFQPDDAVLQVMGLDPMDPTRRATVAGAARDATLDRIERRRPDSKLDLLRS